MEHLPRPCARVLAVAACALVAVGLVAVPASADKTPIRNPPITTPTTVPVIGGGKLPSTTPPPITTTGGLTVSNDFEGGPVSGGRYRLSSSPGSTVTWQQGTAHSGTAAYRLVGGNQLQSDGTGESAIMWWPPRPDPDGLGLRQVVTGWYRFESFPVQDTRPVWLMVTVPTDGVAGADNKPVVAVTQSGQLALAGSNGGGRVDTRTALAVGRWYQIELHAENGTDAVQRLVVRDATGTVIEEVSLALGVTGTYRNRVTKWGFGSRQDAEGTTYTLDDITLLNLPPRPAGS